MSTAPHSHTDPAASLQQEIARFIDHACLRYNGDDQAWRYVRASDWLRQQPILARQDFHCALVAADPDAVRDFLARDPGLATRHGGPRQWPPLMYLTYSRVDCNAQHAVAVAQLLLDHGADPDSEGPVPGGGFNAVTGAIGEGERGPVACVPHPCADALVKLFLDAGAKANQSQALYNVMFGEHLAKWLSLFVQYGLAAGDRANWNPDDPEPIFDFLLCHVVMQGKASLVRFLLEHGANADAVNRYNQRRCHTNAILGGHADIAALLVEYGATAETLPPQDLFCIACREHDHGRVRALLAAHPSLRQDSGLFRGCAMIDVATCLFLVGEGFDINTRDGNGQTVLHNYALWNDADAVRTLLRHGADPDLKEYHYQATPLGLALHHRHWSVIGVLAPLANDVFDVCRTADAARLAVLLARDPSLAARRTPMGNTPLHVVSQVRQENPDLAACTATIALLLRHDADPAAANNQGKTPAQWFRLLGMDNVAGCLAELCGRG